MLLYVYVNIWVWMCLIKLKYVITPAYMLSTVCWVWALSLFVCMNECDYGIVWGWMSSLVCLVLLRAVKSRWRTVQLLLDRTFSEVFTNRWFPSKHRTHQQTLRDGWSFFSLVFSLLFRLLGFITFISVF